MAKVPFHIQQEIIRQVAREFGLTVRGNSPIVLVWTPPRESDLAPEDDWVDEFGRPMVVASLWGDGTATWGGRADMPPVQRFLAGGIPQEVGDLIDKAQNRYEILRKRYLRKQEDTDA